ncbi:MAG: hypothetical protein HYV63_22190 [Candidatus Schekmanbacteria bacterium]|nr:hypothetical protein [Candidatus Schekmanbacteria bacterium]
MAFEWDEHQRELLVKWLRRRAGRVEAQVPVGGATMFLDALVEHPLRSGFFDFLPDWSAIENKAPADSFGIRDLLRFLGKLCLGLESRWGGRCFESKAAGVVIAAKVTREVRDWPQKPTLVRAGILRLGCRPAIFLVLADELPLREPNLPIILHYASHNRVKELVRVVLNQQLTRYLMPLYMYRREALREVASEKEIEMVRKAIDIKSAIEDLGLARVIEEVGLDRVIEEVGLDRVIAEIGRDRLCQALGPEWILEQAAEIMRRRGNGAARTE